MCTTLIENNPGWFGSGSSPKGTYNRKRTYGEVVVLLTQPRRRSMSFLVAHRKLKDPGSWGEEAHAGTNSEQYNKDRPPGGERSAGWFLSTAASSLWIVRVSRCFRLLTLWTCAGHSGTADRLPLTPRSPPSARYWKDSTVYWSVRGGK